MSKNFRRDKDPSAVGMQTVNSYKRMYLRARRAELLLYRASVILEMSGETPSLCDDIKDFLNELPGKPFHKKDGHLNKITERQKQQVIA